VAREPLVSRGSLLLVLIQLERSGGFAGIPRSRSVDTDAVAASEAEEWQRLINAADLAALRGPPALRRPDRFRYVVTVDDGGQRRCVTLDAQDLTDERRELVDRLMMTHADGS
jgi:hypothetical protein